jgi:hypothetical protein
MLSASLSSSPLVVSDADKEIGSSHLKDQQARSTTLPIRPREYGTSINLVMCEGAERGKKVFVPSVEKRRREEEQERMSGSR